MDTSQVAPSLLDISWKARNQPPAPALTRNGCTSLGLLGIFESVSWKKRVLTMIKLMVLFLPTSNSRVRSISLMSYPVNGLYSECRTSLTSLKSLTSLTSLIGITLLARMFLEKCDYILIIFIPIPITTLTLRPHQRDWNKQTAEQVASSLFFCWTENSDIFDCLVL